jgi:hypothetical protein
MKREIHTIPGGLNHKIYSVFPDHCHNGVMGKIIIQDILLSINKMVIIIRWENERKYNILWR